jgi:tight adherence protein B
MVRLSAVVLTLLPVCVTLLITLFNYDYMKPLFTTTAGKVIIVSSVCMISIGFLVLRRMVAFKV